MEAVGDEILLCFDSVPIVFVFHAGPIGQDQHHVGSLLCGFCDKLDAKRKVIETLHGRLNRNGPTGSFVKYG